MPMGKICTKCLEDKPKTDYYKHKNGKEGLNPVCKSCWKGDIKLYDISNPRIEYRRNRYENLDKDVLNKRVRKRYKERYKSDIDYKLVCNIRSRIWHAIKGHIKGLNIRELLGVDIEVYKKYLEGLFQEGMSWENHGEWEIDHIKPCDCFDLSKLEEQKSCFHYTNTQPLWKLNNRKKSNKY
jgi:hypothetical protein